MDKPYITEKRIRSYQIPFGKGVITVNEYSPSFTKEEEKINEIMIKSILAKAFKKDE